MSVRRTAIVALALLVVTAAPYAYAVLSTPPGLVYTGLMYDVPDHAQYWAWVTASRHGLFIANPMTPEVNPPVFFNAMMWILARIQQAFAISFPTLFQLWRVGAVVFTMVALRSFLNTLVPDAARRDTAFWVALVGSGLGWILILAKTVLRLTDAPFPTDVYTVEPNTFWALLSYPYIALSQALLLLIITGAWKTQLTGERSGMVLATVSACALALVHASDLVIVYAVLGACAAWLAVKHRAMPWRLIQVGALVMAVSAPIAAYYRTLTTSSPLWRSILAQYGNAGVWTPSPPHLALLLGVPLVLAIAALRGSRDQSDRRALVTVWLLVGVVLPYLPVVYQIKLLGGLQFPLAVLAADAWHERVVPVVAGARVWSRLAAVPVARTVLILLVLPTNVYLFAWRFSELSRHGDPYYLRRDEIQALEWLEQNGTGSDVVLAPESLGRFVAGYAGRRTYLAHWAMTNRYFERREKAATFFHDGTPDHWRDQLVHDERVTFIVWSQPAGAAAGPDDPGVSPSRQLVFARPRARIYRAAQRSGDPE